MHVAVKILFGLILIAASIYYIIYGLPGYLPAALPDVLTVLNGAVPVFVLLLGIFIVWLEWDEWKIEQELKKEEERARRELAVKTKRKKKRKK